MNMNQKHQCLTEKGFL
jgi:hypothetical protein